MKNQIKIIRVSRRTDLSMPKKNSLVNLCRFTNLQKVLSAYSWKLISIIGQKRLKGLSQVNLFYKFGTYIYVLKRRHGVGYVVKYLKACSLAIQRAVAGSPMSSLREIEPDLALPRLSSCGLPVIIGSRDRRSILAGSRKSIQLYSTLFGLYRIIDAPVKAKINTITDPFSGDLGSLEEIGRWFRINSGQLLEPFNKSWDLKVRGIKLISKSSPSNSLSWKGLGMDLVALLNVEHLAEAMFVFLIKSGSKGFLETMLQIYKDIAHLPCLTADKWSKHVANGDYDQIPLGQLSFKKEAAGKLRVFAMVDIWTQALMRPLHDSLFSILGKLPNDGTMDQEASFARAQVKAQQYGCCYGYDLSSATDRLPIEAQIQILASLSKDMDYAKSWAQLLTSRPYKVSRNSYDIPEGDYYYEVGQPMGALSSWAMLAITHHMVMQYCSMRAYPTPIGKRKWEDRYEVLGDDIVIFDSKLAAFYLQVMGLLGVPINESKSVITLPGSKHIVVEFAKRLSVNGRDASPLSWKMFLSQDSYPGHLAIIDFLSRRLKVFGRNFNVVLAKAMWDRRPENDHAGMMAFFVSSLLSGKGDWRVIIPWFQEGGVLSWKNKRLVSSGLPLNIVSAYISNHYQGDANLAIPKWDRKLTATENEFRLSLMKERSRILNSIPLDSHIKVTQMILKEAGIGSCSVTLTNLVEKAFFGPIFKVSLFKNRNASNDTLGELITSISRCTLLSKSFEFSPKKVNSQLYELATVPLSVLKFTRTPVKDPMLNFKANFGNMSSRDGPPLNTSKGDKAFNLGFGFNF